MATEFCVGDFPPGYYFMPTDYDLLKYYLERKVNNQVLPRNMMHDVDIYQFDPQTLAEKYVAQGENQWYFFTPRDRKYKRGGRPSRSASGGSWKATNGDKEIKCNGTLIGYKKILTFQPTSPLEDQDSNWIMHEYILVDSAYPIGSGMRLNDFVLCKIYKTIRTKRRATFSNAQEKRRKSQGKDSENIPLSIENSPPEYNHLTQPEMPCNQSTEVGFEAINELEIPSNSTMDTLFDYGLDLDKFFGDTPEIVLDELMDRWKTM